MIKNSSYLEFFPYPKFRLEQEDIIEKIEFLARIHKNILLVAPNGTGKTIMALSSLLPVARDKKLKIIYLCRTHAQSTRVIRELQKIHHSSPNNNKYTSGISLRGRKEMCLNTTLNSMRVSPTEAMSICKSLRSNNSCNHYRNIKKFLKGGNSLDFYNFEGPLDAEELITMSKDRRYCAYFLAKFLLKKAPIIVCNFQWIFNPDIRYRFLKFLETALEKCILVIDEAHNIVDLATEVNSDKLTPYFLTMSLNEIHTYRLPDKYWQFINFLKDHLAQKKKDLKNGELELNPKEFITHLYKKFKLKSITEFKRFLEKFRDDAKISIQAQEKDNTKKEPSQDYIKIVVKFWLNWSRKLESERYFFCYHVKTAARKKYISLEIVALDPRDITVPIYKKSFASLSLSGTINPSVFTHLTGLSYKQQGYEIIITKSPFKSRNILALVTEGVATDYNNRNPFMYNKIITKIIEVVSNTPANIGIFCASYKILNDLIMNGIKISIQNTGKKLFAEESNISASKNAKILENFKAFSQPPHKGAVLLGVCGGRNCEGEDYPGDFMNAVIIVGIPYHLQTPRVKAKIEYYNKVFNRQGWVFAYLYPAMQRANQASGRPIRKESDKGVIVFMDSRFRERRGWISEWVRKEIKLIPNKKNSISSTVKEFWRI